MDPHPLWQAPNCNLEVVSWVVTEAVTTICRAESTMPVNITYYANLHPANEINESITTN